MLSHILCLAPAAVQLQLQCRGCPRAMLWPGLKRFDLDKLLVWELHWNAPGGACCWEEWGYAVSLGVHRDVLLQPRCQLAFLGKMRVSPPFILSFYLQFFFCGHSCLHWMQLMNTCIFCALLLLRFPRTSPPPVPVSPWYYIFWLLFRATTSRKRGNIVILEQYEKGDMTFFHTGG